jgi:hypothetical protein
MKEHLTDGEMNFNGASQICLWLYLLTREDGKTVQLNIKILASNDIVFQSYLRISLLSQEEDNALDIEIHTEMARIGLQEQCIAQGMAQGMAETKKKVVRNFLKRKAELSELDFEGLSGLVDVGRKDVRISFRK